MKLSLATHGGWTGRFAAPQTIDTADLQPEAAAEGNQLALAAEAASQAGPAADTAARSARAPEAQSYTITIDHGDRSATVKASDVDPDPACRALLDWVRAHLPR